ncbi:MAG: hypothetical protein JW900_13170 [Anaerolineae bacterium]|nr:hypothetical protein [Anaerolineae bacterium]
MKHKNLLVVVSILVLVTLSCSIGGASNGDDDSGITIPLPDLGGEETSPPEPEDSPPEIADLTTLDSYRVEMTMRAEGEGGEMQEMTILQEWVRDPLAMRFVMSDPTGMMDIEAITIGNMNWIRVGDMWVQSETPVEQEGLTDMWEGLMTDPEGWGLVGEETINGIHCKHYSTNGEYSMTIPDPETGGTTTFTAEGEMWIADEADLPTITIRMWMETEGSFFPMPTGGGTSQSATIYWEYNVTSVNEPITIEPPEQ